MQHTWLPCKRPLNWIAIIIIIIIIKLLLFFVIIIKYIYVAQGCSLLSAANMLGRQLHIEKQHFQFVSEHI